jgi:hypothetical protein
MHQSVKIDQVESTRPDCVARCRDVALGMCLNATRRKDLCGRIIDAVGQSRYLERLSEGLRIVVWRDGDWKGGLLRLKQLNLLSAPAFICNIREGDIRQLSLTRCWPRLLAR